jgi:hypothetical protein
MTSPYSEADRYADFNPATLVATGRTVPAEQLPEPGDDASVWVTTSFRDATRPAPPGDRVRESPRGVDKSTLLRQWIDMQLVAEGETAGEPISRGDALRALAGLPPLRRSA